MDHARSSAAAGLRFVASAVIDSADGLPGGEAVRSAAHATAGAIKSTADYVRDNDMKGVWADVMKLVKGNPGVALLTAAAAGFLVARMLSKD